MTDRIEELLAERQPTRDPATADELGTIGPHQLLELLPQLSTSPIRKLEASFLAWLQDDSAWTAKLDKAIEELPLLEEIVFPVEWNVA